jgi:hypothetical protein
VRRASRLPGEVECEFNLSRNGILHRKAMSRAQDKAQEGKQVLWQTRTQTQAAARLDLEASAGV